MTDAYWDELGVTWRTEVPNVADVGRFKSGLRTRVESRQMSGRYVKLLVAWFALLAFGQGAWLLYAASLNDAPASANRTYLIIGIFGLCLGVVMIAAQIWVHGVKQRGDTTDLANMLEMASVQAERQLRSILVLSCFMFALGALLSAMIVVSIARKTDMAIVSMVFVVGSMVLCVVQFAQMYRRARAEVAKFRHLQALLAPRAD